MFRTGTRVLAAVLLGVSTIMSHWSLVCVMCLALAFAILLADVAVKQCERSYMRFINDQDTHRDIGDRHKNK